jgi:leucyl aminopeptidase
MIVVLQTSVKPDTVTQTPEPPMKINVKQSLERLQSRHLEQAGYAIVLVPESEPLPALPHANRVRAQLARLRNRKTDRCVVDLPTAAGTKLIVGRVKATLSEFELLGLARRLVSALGEYSATDVMLSTAGMNKATAERGLLALVSAALAAAHALTEFKSTPSPASPLRAISVVHPARLDLRATQIAANANNLARTLTALPPNELTPRKYRERLAPLARQHGWSVKFYGERDLKRAGAGAFLAVAQGSPDRDAGILKLCYEPRRRGKKPALALVGKGICFDTGGMNLKPARHMHGMHEDMAGSAVAVGVLQALTELKVDYPVRCWLALAQNHIGPHAYKQNDVVKAANGLSIEIVHTDAEGRMVLADTLHLAGADKPGLIVDYATLTGSCIAALGTSYSGVFTHDEKLREAAIAAGRRSGERVWPFPMDGDFDSALESQVADIKQCTLDNEADHILAARFLSRFVAAGTRWLHVDLSAISHKGGLAHIPTDVTGFGVRFTLALLAAWPPRA